MPRQGHSRGSARTAGERAKRAVPPARRARLPCGTVRVRGQGATPGEPPKAIAIGGEGLFASAQQNFRGLLSRQRTRAG
jgi:hypothetical protein